MKNKLIIALTLLWCTLSAAHAQTDSELLQQKLAKVSTMQADFSQQVISAQGDLIQQSVGKLTIARPGNFYWQVTSPDEELIVSNGVDMWLYSPFIEQVTIMNFSDAIAGTPFALLSGADASEWQNFDVQQKEGAFVVANNQNKVNANQFTFVFDKADHISQFSVKEAQGQTSTFTLSNNKAASNLSDDFFEFEIPAGIEIDDQR
ncbi:outer membrane lipoprotein carrier protein LolA [Psychromonas sp. B3M02]|uniref:outer membrane lipoprotein chaperone LolA n=1 Tax=Psychromonas sp. B3M02 TaxID=2267226 RepID=UPI000DEB18CE|nr:outer membrane lipoprotein chaperone LolA [Psychromonas sp. B3M02]RBW46043.1 outer membrane lipoprotein carrier protein LolA [Psychromonas sp. B3M02]